MTVEELQKNYNSINDAETEPVTLQYVIMDHTSCFTSCTRAFFIMINFVIFVSEIIIS